MSLISCLDCGASISDAAPACIHCGRPKSATGAQQPAPSQPKFREEKRGGEGLRFIGWLALAAGICGLLLIAGMDTTVSTGGEYIAGAYIPEQRVHNLGLMNEKQNWLIISGAGALIGLALVGVGYAQRESVRVRIPEPRKSRLTPDGG